MHEHREETPLKVVYFSWDDWDALWILTNYQLNENGIEGPIDDIPPRGMNVGRDGYEWDFHHIEEIYLSGEGGFWIAYWDGDPAGFVGGQDLDGVLELRHMYVRAEYRQRGIGTRLVQALIDHAKTHQVKAVELWTAPDDLGRILYSKLGFKVVEKPFMNLEELIYRMNRAPGEGEIRMRLDIMSK